MEEREKREHLLMDSLQYSLQSDEIEHVVDAVVRLSHRNAMNALFAEDLSDVEQSELIIVVGVCVCARTFIKIIAVQCRTDLIFADTVVRTRPFALC